MKAWRDDLEAHVKKWSAKLKKEGREWWPKFIYHFTDVQNARAILNSGELLSRERVLAGRGMPHDNANAEIIAQTNPAHLELVRFFFRPRTPTQYVNEGIQLPHQRTSGHCPVPVFFLFDFVDLVSRDDASFSRGTLASNHFGLSNRRDYFRSINFEDVYHEGGLGHGPSAKKQRIKQARMAEVVVRDRLELGPELRAVCCRSEAERATLLHGLTPPVRKEWKRRIRTGIDSLFFRKYRYVRLASGAENRHIRVELGGRLGTRGDLRLTMTADSGQPYGGDYELAPTDHSAQFRLPRDEDAGAVRLELDGCLAYEGRVLLSDLPF